MLAGRVYSVERDPFIQAADPLTHEGVYQLEVGANAVQVTCMDEIVPRMPGPTLRQVESGEGSLIEQGICA